MENDNMKLKAYKRLAELRGKMFSKILYEARNKTEYAHLDSNTEKEIRKWIGAIANPDKWEYFGILSKEDMRELETLEFLLNDDKTEMEKYKEWKVPAR